MKMFLYLIKGKVFHRPDHEFKTWEEDFGSLEMLEDPPLNLGIMCGMFGRCRSLGEVGDSYVLGQQCQVVWVVLECVFFGMTPRRCDEVLTCVGMVKEGK